MRTVKVYAASIGKSFQGSGENYGDALMTPLLRTLFDVDPAYTSLSRAELIGVGSILDVYQRRKRRVSFFGRRPWRTLHVWGSGFMFADADAVWPQKLSVHAVRGPLSQRKMALPDIALGDPAILLPLIWQKPAEVRSKVAVVPHFATMNTFAEKYTPILPPDWTTVNLLDDTYKVTMQIASAEMVVSSSLHGLIVADAYGVPSIWIEPHGKIKGDGFKFADHFAFVGRHDIKPETFERLLKEPERLKSATAGEILPQAREALLKAFPDFL